LEIVSDLYLNPLFDPEEIEKERGVIIEEINMYEDTPMRRVQEIFTALLYGDQPAGWDIGGEKEIIHKLQKDDFVNYRDERYVASGTVVVVAGKFNEKAVVKQIKGYFGKLPRRKASAKSKTKEAQRKPEIKIKFKESGQSHLMVGFRAFNLFDKRRFALQVLADLLGGGMSSRLWKHVREELGAAYYVSADADLFLDHGVFEVSAGVDHGKIDVVVKAILEECRNLREELVSEKELQKTKDHMIGGMILGLETSDSLASFYGGQEILTKKLVSPQTIIDSVRAVTAAEIRAVAKTIFVDRGLNLAVIGPYQHESLFEHILTVQEKNKR
jgi:predicted Zn-dependent peptidase